MMDCATKPQKERTIGHVEKTIYSSHPGNSHFSASSSDYEYIYTYTSLKVSVFDFEIFFTSSLVIFFSRKYIFQDFSRGLLTISTRFSKPALRP
jgi:hypothetical protein